MSNEMVGVPTNCTFTDFVGIQHPDGLCTAYETATNTTCKNGTVMTIDDKLSGHIYILHSGQSEYSLSKIGGGTFTQEIGYAYKKVNGSWVLDTDFNPNPTLIQ